MEKIFLGSKGRQILSKWIISNIQKGHCRPYGVSPNNWIKYCQGYSAYLLPHDLRLMIERFRDNSILEDLMLMEWKMEGSYSGQGFRKPSAS
jgi:hypothetical protein